MAEKLLGIADSMVSRAAYGVTRRRLFRNAGGVALGAAFATAYAGADSAFAHADDACGPSPMCPDSRCQDTDKQRCAAGRDDTTWRPHGGGECQGFQGSLDRHCWTACAHGERYRCCDCCVRGTSLGSTSCFGCQLSGDWRRCICGKKIANTC